jgi:hypothetical protein
MDAFAVIGEDFDDAAAHRRGRGRAQAGAGFKFGRKLSFNTFVRVAPVFLMLLPYY